MKQITKMSRLTGELEKAFRLINEELFNNELPTPIITVIPTPRAYAHYVPFDIWSTKESAKREINIASGTLDRPIENIISSLVHEMVHPCSSTALYISLKKSVSPLLIDFSSISFGLNDSGLEPIKFSTVTLKRFRESSRLTHLSAILTNLLYAKVLESFGKDVKSP